MERTEYRMGPSSELPTSPQTGSHYGHAMEHARRRMRPGLWLSAFAFGAAVGGALGLLFAPRRGSEIRAALAENVSAQGVSREFQKRVNDLLTSGRAGPADLVRQAQRDLEDLRSQAVNRLDDARLRGRILRKQAELRYLQGRERLRRMT